MFIPLIVIYAFHFKTIEWTTILPSSLFSFFVLLSIAMRRVSANFTLSISFFDFSFLNFIVQSLAFTGNSLGVLAYTIQLKDEFFNSTPFFFGYIPALFSFAPNYTIEGIESKNYLAQHLIYLLSPEKLLQGSTIGTSISAEFYELVNGNWLGILLLSTLMLYLSNIIIKNLYKNYVTFYLGYLYIQNLILAPRNSIMKIFNKETLISLVLLYLLLFLFKKRNHYFTKLL